VARLRAGLPLRVAAPAAGPVSVVATVKGSLIGLRGAAARRPAIVARGTARAASAGFVAPKLTLTPLGRSRAGRLKGLRVTVTTTLGARVRTGKLLVK